MIVVPGDEVIAKFNESGTTPQDASSENGQAKESPTGHSGPTSNVRIPFSSQQAEEMDSQARTVETELTEPKRRNPGEYLVLLAPAVSLLLVLTNRQSRVSTLARENCKTLHAKATEAKRIPGLRAQNRLLFCRYVIIKFAQLLLFLALFGLGYLAFDEFFHGTSEGLLMFYAGVVVMIAGTMATFIELVYGADTLWNEIDHAGWDGQGEPPEFLYFSALRAPWWEPIWTSMVGLIKSILSLFSEQEGSRWRRH
ncbi:MAG: DUF2721 domain-containing protein [Planctomycetaceae bacterium]|nr:DUF2721 domain-containing protein [Planctomycetaceae bacterium]